MTRVQRSSFGINSTFFNDFVFWIVRYAYDVRGRPEPLHAVLDG